MRRELALYLFPLLLILGGGIFGWLARWYRYGGRCRPGGLAEGVPNVDVARETVTLDGSEPVMNTGRRRAAVADGAKAALGSLTGGYERGRDDRMPQDDSALATAGAAVGGAVASIGGAASAAAETAKSAVEPLTDGTAREEAGSALRRAGDGVSGAVSDAADATKASFASVRDGYDEGAAPGETSDAPGDGSLAAKAGALAGGAVATAKDAVASVTEGTKSAFASVTGDEAGRGTDGEDDTRTDPPGTYTPTGAAGFGSASGTDGSTLDAMKAGYAEGAAPGETSDAPGDGSLAAKAAALVGSAVAATKDAASSVAEGTQSAFASVTGRGDDGTKPDDASGTDKSTLDALKDGYAEGAAPGETSDAPADGSVAAKAGALAGGAVAAVSGAVSTASDKLAGATIGQEDGHVLGEGDAQAGDAQEGDAQADDADYGSGEPEVDIPADFSAEEQEAQRLIEREEGVTRPATLLAAPREDRAPDDLKRIKGIGPKIETTLNDEGVYYFDQIAGFGASDIAWADRTLAVRGRVVRDRWVPQAQGLAALGPDDGADSDDDASEPVDTGITEPLSEDEREAQRIIETGAPVEKPASALAAPREDRAPDDLQRIKGIGPKIETTLNDEGVYYFDQIAGFGASDIAWADRTLAVRGRVVRDRWVPQAQGLAALEPDGEETDTASMRTRFAALGDAAEDGGDAPDTVIDEPLSEAEREAQRIIETEEAVEKPASALDTPRQGRAPDDLQRIGGIGPKIEATLNGEGIYYYDQIAGFGGRDLAWADRTLGFRGRVVRDRWIPQARGLATEAGDARDVSYAGDTTASPDSPKNTPLSEAEREALRLVEQEGGFAATAENRPELLMRDGPVGGKPDDLRRIKGIGEKLEGVLNGLGVYYFRQIAGFTARDIAWIDSKLKFKGRIIRDRWVPQAQVFARERNDG